MAPPIPITPKPGVINISMNRRTPPKISKKPLISGILNQDPSNDNNMAITPNISAPRPGVEIPNNRAKIPKIKSNEVRIGFDNSFNT